MTLREQCNRTVLDGIPMAGMQHSRGVAMQTMGLPKESKPSKDAHGPLDFELLDLYVAIFIVVPVALFLKSLWS